MNYPKAVPGVVIVAALFCLTACSQARPPIQNATQAPECIYVPPQPEVPPDDPFDMDEDEDGLTKLQRLDFIRRNVASTIKVRIRRYTPEKGYTFHYGTGVFIDEHHALTAEHVVVDQADIYVVLRRVVRGSLKVGQLRVERAEVIATSPERDVALLRVHAPSDLVEPMPIAKNWRPRKNELLWQFGSRTFWSRGRVVRQIPDVGKSPIRGMVQMRQLGQCGDSGGPVTTTKGELVGLILRGNARCGRQYFVPIDTALKSVGLRP